MPSRPIPLLVFTSSHHHKSLYFSDSRAAHLSFGRLVSDFLPAAAAAIGVLVTCAFLFLFRWYRKFVKKRSSNKTSPDDAGSGSVKLERFKYRQLRRATRGFSESQKLGKGGFGVVYKGVLKNGREVAVKRLDLSSLQGEREFQSEISICGGLSSPYIVKLLGYCTHGTRIKLLVYEYMQNRSLQEALFEKAYPVCLNWDKRYKIICDIAKALEYLHIQCNPPIIHGDVKPSNILLDGDFSARIADFGLARFKSEEYESDGDKNSTCSAATPCTPKRFSFGTSEQIAPGTAEMNWNSPTRNSHTEAAFVYKPPVDRQASKNRIATGEASCESEDRPSPSHRKSRQPAYSSSEVRVLHKEKQMAAELKLTKDTRAEVRARGPCVDALLQNETPSWNGQVTNDSWLKAAGEESIGKSYVMDWLGNASKPDEIVPADGEKATNHTNRHDRPQREKKNWNMHRKGREWWKDEYFAELSSKTQAKQNVMGKRNMFDRTLDDFSNDFSGEFRRSEQRFIGKDGTRNRSKEWFRGLRTQSISSDMWSGELHLGQFYGEYRQHLSGELNKSGELLSLKDVSSTTSMRGTVCYVAPEYGGNGLPSEKGDIYSFGVLMLVIVSGRRPIQVSASPMKEFEKANLISWARSLSQSGKLLDLLDERLGMEYDRKQALLCITLALLCLQRLPSNRPDITDVVRILSGETASLVLPLDLSPSPRRRIHHYKMPN